MRLRAAGDIVLVVRDFFAGTTTIFLSLAFAHRALWAAAILRRPAADISRLTGLDAPFSLTPSRADMARSIRLRSSRSCTSTASRFGIRTDYNLQHPDHEPVD